MNNLLFRVKGTANYSGEYLTVPNEDKGKKTHYVNKKCFSVFSDNVPALQLGEWPLEATMYEGEATAGPVPTFFSEDPVATTDALKANTVKAHSDYQRIAKAFFMPEVLLAEEAIAMVKKPR